MSVWTPIDPEMALESGTGLVLQMPTAGREDFGEQMLVWVGSSGEGAPRNEDTKIFPCWSFLQGSGELLLV